MRGCTGRKEKLALAGVFLIITILIFCSLSFAAAGPGTDRSSDLLDLLYRFINFALLVIILVLVLKKANLKGLLSARSEEIARKLDELRSRKEEADRQFRELERRIREFEESRQKIVDQFRTEGLAEKNRLISEAETRAKQILDQAEATIRREMETAKHRLKQDMIDLAAKNAEKILSKEITEGDQDRLVDDFIERVGKPH